MDTTYLNVIANRFNLGAIANTSLDKAADFLAKFDVSIESRTGAFMVCATRAASVELASVGFNANQLTIIALAFGGFIRRYHRGEVGNVAVAFKQALMEAFERQPASLPDTMSIMSKQNELIDICNTYLTARRNDKYQATQLH